MLVFLSFPLFLPSSSPPPPNPASPPFPPAVKSEAAASLAVHSPSTLATPAGSGTATANSTPGDSQGPPQRTLKAVHPPQTRCSRVWPEFSFTAGVGLGMRNSRRNPDTASGEPTKSWLCWDSLSEWGGGSTPSESQCPYLCEGHRKHTDLMGPCHEQETALPGTPCARLGCFSKGSRVWLRVWKEEQSRP